MGCEACLQLCPYLIAVIVGRDRPVNVIITWRFSMLGAIQLDQCLSTADEMTRLLLKVLVYYDNIALPGAVDGRAMFENPLLDLYCAALRRLRQDPWLSHEMLFSIAFAKISLLLASAKLGLLRLLCCCPMVSGCCHKTGPVCP